MKGKQKSNHPFVCSVNRKGQGEKRGRYRDANVFVHTVREGERAGGNQSAGVS